MFCVGNYAHTERKYKLQIILRKTAQEKQLYLFCNYITNFVLNLKNCNRGKQNVDWITLGNPSACIDVEVVPANKLDHIGKDVSH
jgi:hypothetical protein